MLEKEFKYYLDNQLELLKKYKGKFIVINNLNIVGTYDSHMDAYNWASANYKAGSFLIQHCLPGSDSYSQTFHSRVIFNTVLI